MRVGLIRGAVFAGAAIAVVALILAAPVSSSTPENRQVLLASEAVQSAASDVRFVVTAAGNSARYRVRERLVGRDLPNDAVGETSEVSGAIVVAADGTLNPAASRIVVRVSSLTSDSDRRDGFIRRRTLETEQFPIVEFAPTAVNGISSPPPPWGTRTFTMLGNLTVRNVTRPTTWAVTATFAGDTVKGTASTRFTFDDFSMTQPRVPVVLSVADTIRLEYDFQLLRAR